MNMPKHYIDTNFMNKEERNAIETLVGAIAIKHAFVDRQKAIEERKAEQETKNDNFRGILSGIGKAK